MSDSSSGGLDILAIIINRKFKSIKTSSILMFFDILVFILVSAVFGIYSVMYGILISLVRSITMTYINEYFFSTIQYFIICDRSEVIVN
ncbi:YitT family protein [Clostridium sp. Marseille-Q7071]